MTRPSPVQQRFVEYLCKLGDRESPDRAALAALRRAAGSYPGTSAAAHPYVAPWIPMEMSDREADAFYLIAALFATHPMNWETNLDQPGRTNFGASFHQLRNEESESVERRFVALLNSHRDDLPNHLRHAVSLLRTNEVRVDFAQLLQDMRYWDHPDRFVQRDWARSFWAPTREAQPQTVVADSTHI